MPRPSAVAAMALVMATSSHGAVESPEG